MSTYKKKHGPALWTQVPGRKPVPGPAAKPPARIRQSTTARAAQQRVYRAAARAFVEAAIAAGETCPVVAAIPELRGGTKYGHPISGKLSECHHVFGRRGRLLLWKPGWLAVSKQGHRWINAHPQEAREHGWLGPLGTWNDYERAKAYVANRIRLNDPKFVDQINRFALGQVAAMLTTKKEP